MCACRVVAREREGSSWREGRPHPRRRLARTPAGLGRTQRRPGQAAGARAGYTFLHSAVDGFSRLAHTEPLPNETATTAVAFLARARAFFAAHGITA
jgi:hypothetical protein